MDISNYNKAEVLAALYNGSSAQGMGFLNPNHMNQMSVEEAQELLDSGQTYFDYVNGRVMKIDLSGDELDPYLYDRDRGQGACERIISRLKQNTTSATAGYASGIDPYDNSISPEIASSFYTPSDNDAIGSSYDDTPSIDASSNSSSDYSGQGGDFGGAGSSDSW